MPEVAEDQVAQAVSQLRESVEGMREGLVDEEKVRRIAEDVVAANAAAAATRGGYTPPDEDPELDARGLSPIPHKRLAQLRQMPAERAAKAARRDVAVVEEFHRHSDRLLMVATALGVNPRDTSYWENEYLPSLRAMDTATSNEGAEYVPTNLSASLIERVSLDLMVVQLFPVIPMPTNPFDIPGRAVSRQRAGRNVEQTADTGQTKIKKLTPATRKITLDAVGFSGEALVSKAAEEDSIIALLDFIEEELVDYLVADLEDAAQNGDTAGSHRDTDVSSADDPRKNWDGLRKTANAASAERDAGADKLTPADLLAQRGLMGKYGVKPSDLAHIVGIASYIDLLSDPSVQTIDKYGQNATILSGELGKSHGVPIIVSESVREDLDSAGIYNVAGDLSIALTAYRKSHARGIRRDLTVQVLKELYAESDQDALVVTSRQALENRYPDEPVVAASTNVAPGVDPA